MEQNVVNGSVKNEYLHYSLLQEENIFDYLERTTLSLQRRVDNLEKKKFQDRMQSNSLYDHRENFYEDQ